MVKLNHLIRATKDSEWSKMVKGRLLILCDFMVLCNEMYILINYYGSSLADRNKFHKYEKFPRLHDVT